MQLDAKGAIRLKKARSICAIAFSFTTLGLASDLQAQTPSQAIFTPDDVFRLKTVDDIRISPDGGTIAYQTSDADIMIDASRHAVRMIDVATRRDWLLAEGSSSPRWSPDGRLIAYTSPGAGGRTRVMIAAIKRGAARMVAEIPGSPSEFSWSPDGRTIAFTMFVPEAGPTMQMPVTRPKDATWAAPPRIITGVRYEEDGQGMVAPGHVQLFTLPIAGGTPTQITTAPLDVQNPPSWTPDGSALIYSATNVDTLGANFHISGIYVVPASGGRARIISPSTLSGQMPSVSPDGQSVAFVAWTADGRDYSPSRLYVVDLGGGNLRQIGKSLDRDITSAVWADDGHSIYASYGDRGVDKIGRFPLDNSKITEIAANVTGDFSLSSNETIAYAAARSDRPADVAIQLRGGGSKVLTHRNEGLLAGKLLGIVRPLAVKSSLDGTAVGSWLTLPPRYDARRRYPLILDIHGGPYGYNSPVWSTKDQLYAAAGYVVLHANYRGSTSYGFAFADRIAQDPVGPSYTDLMSAVDAAVETGVADPDRLFVTGGSAGGKLTAWIVGNTTRFKAAVAEKPVINETTSALLSDQYYASELISGTKPWDDPMRFWAMSALSQVAKVATPTMLIVGEEDRRTPISEAKQLYNALTLRRIPTALVLVPGASHSTIGRRPSQAGILAKLTLDWFRQFDR